MSALPAAALTSSSIATGTSRKCILSITAPANQDVEIETVSVSFDGQTAGNPKVLVQLEHDAKASTSGSGSSSVTPVARDYRLSSIQTAAAEGYSTAPTGGSIVAQELVHPQGGYTFREKFTVQRGKCFAVFCTVATSVGCRARISFEE